MSEVTTPTLTYAKAKKLLRKAVKEKGSEYVYQLPEGGACSYVRDGAPSCLVGHVLYKAGVDIETLIELDHETWTDVATAVETEVFPVEVDIETKLLLARAQELQDDGVSWGYSVERAIALVEGRE